MLTYDTTQLSYLVYKITNTVDKSTRLT